MPIESIKAPQMLYDKGECCMKTSDKVIKLTQLKADHPARSKSHERVPMNSKTHLVQLCLDLSPCYCYYF